MYVCDLKILPPTSFPVYDISIGLQRFVVTRIRHTLLEDLNNKDYKREIKRENER